jgi:hypothetical protein
MKWPATGKVQFANIVIELCKQTRIRPAYYIANYQQCNILVHFVETVYTAHFAHFSRIPCSSICFDPPAAATVRWLQR